MVGGVLGFLALLFAADTAAHSYGGGSAPSLLTPSFRKFTSEMFQTLTIRAGPVVR